MPNYTKLFNSIITSTIWTEDDRTRIVWITMLALSDQNGEIHASIPGLARVAGVSVEDAETAIEKFLAPDKYSRTPDHEGRRIVEIEGGWELLNHEKYRKMASKEDSKEAAAERQRRKRERKGSVTLERDSHALSRPVTPVSRDVTENRDIADTDTDTDISTHTHTRARARPTQDEVEQFALTERLDSDAALACFWHYDATATPAGWINGSGNSLQWQATVKRWVHDDKRKQIAATQPVSPKRGTRPRKEFDASRNVL